MKNLISKYIYGRTYEQLTGAERFDLDYAIEQKLKKAGKFLAIGILVAIAVYLFRHHFSDIGNFIKRILYRAADDFANRYAR